MPTSEQIQHKKKCISCSNDYIDSMSKLFGQFPIPVKVFKVDTGTCRDCISIQQNLAQAQSEALNLNWNFDTVKIFFKENPPAKGDKLIIFDTSYNVLTYALVEVIDTTNSRLYVSGYTNGYTGAAFYYSGKNCMAPKGQARLLPYHETIANKILESGTTYIRLKAEEVNSLLASPV